ncbi:MAG TPA: SpoIIE family protein phosphatase, partial [Oscillospiraceae bacterium]|nr:SpoIIE family protein phosphatase [Oscillospiraceae bacterium]
MSKNQALGQALWSMRKQNQISLTKILAVSFISAILSRGSILGGLSPFPTAFVASLSGIDAVVAFLGSLIGYISTGTVSISMPSIISMLTVIIARFIVDIIFMAKLRHTGISILSSLCSVVTGLTIYLGAIEVDAIGIILVVCNAVLTGALTYFLMLTYRAVKSGTPFITLSPVYAASIAVTMVMGIAAASSISLSVLNLGRIVGALFILFAAERYKQVGGSICGVLVSFGLMVNSPTIGNTAAMLAFAGLISGLFHRFGKFIQTVAFISANAIGLIIIGVDISTVGVLADVMVATVIFTFFPAGAVNRIDISGKLAQRKSVELSDVVAARLEFAAGTIIDVRKSVDSVSKTMENEALGDTEWVYNSAIEEVCKRCGLNTRCWQKNYDRTTQAMIECVNTLRERDKLDKSELPDYLTRYCCKRDELTALLNKYYREYRTNRSLTGKMAEMRRLMDEQLDGISGMLTVMSSEMSEVEEYDVESAQLVMDVLEKTGMMGARVSAELDSCGRMSIQAFAKTSPTTSRQQLTALISDAVGREFDLPEIYKVDSVVKLTMFECAGFILDVKASQISSGKSRVSGDSYEVFTDSKGFCYLCLSDGMGSGKRAAVDSVMTCGLFMKLLRASVGLDAAIKLVNSSLIVKSAEESFATIDLCRVDLYTGVVELLKAGAAETFVRKGKSVASFESTSLPIGMLGGAEFERSRVKLS